MTIVAKTTVAFKTQQDLDIVLNGTMWFQFLSYLGGTNIQLDVSQEGTSIVRKWFDKSKAGDYTLWIEKQLKDLNIDATVTLEDYTE